VDGFRRCARNSELGKMDISKIFSATPVNMSSLLLPHGQCFYIPIYQRKYSWSKENIDTLMSDISGGVSELLENKDAVTFIGTLITIHDVNNAAIAPLHVGQLPTKVLTVIDGQQRLTTLMLIAAALHSQIVSRSAKLKSVDPAHIWIQGQAEATCNVLIQLIESDAGHGEMRFYPRIIRAELDAWSRKVGEAEYKSPIGHFLHSYGEAVRRNEQGPIKLDNQDVISARFKQINGIVNKEIGGWLASEDEGGPQFPKNSELLAGGKVAKELFLDDLPTEAIALFSETEDSNLRFQQLVRILVFAKYLLGNVAVTHVTATSEDYAFDMFEALNTTGEPLTALETFRARVIRRETLPLYKSSPSSAALERVDEYLGTKAEGNVKQRATAEFLTVFALAESGTKLSKAVKNQRRFLAGSYDRPGDEIEDCRSFVNHLSLNADVFSGAWISLPDGDPALPGVLLDTETKFCLAVLKAADHHIALAALTRVYDLFRSGEMSNNDLCAAIRGFVGFFGLWRGAFGTTEGIDQVYRDLLRDGAPGDGIGPLSRRPMAEVAIKGPPTLDGILQYFRNRLSLKDLGKQDQWVKRAASVEVYTKSLPLTRLLLLAANHNSVPDEKQPGLLKPGLAGIAPRLTYGTWVDEGSHTIEHIAPQKQGKWADDLYENPGLKHTLGNLTLIPLLENIVMNNDEWAIKRACFEVLSCATEQDALIAKAKAQAAGLELPPQVLSNTRYRVFASELHSVEEWDTAIVHSRSQSIAQLAWGNLSPWLGYS